MLSVLGLFVFHLKTAPIDQRTRATDWRHQRSDVLGARAPSKYLGPGADVITLQGKIAHDIAGTELSLDALRLMADTGEPYMLIQGDGKVLGMFEIDALSETASAFFPDGTPRWIEFNLTLTRVPDDRADHLALVTAPLSLL